MFPPATENYLKFISALTKRHNALSDVKELEVEGREERLPIGADIAGRIREERGT
jgi:hypothetical protein